MTKLPLHKGIDISKHQTSAKINFNSLKGLGYSFVIIRAGYGKFRSQKDTEFEKHYKAATDAGLKVGAYHYSYALTVEEALQEADCFLDWIKGKKLEYPVAFDMEDSTQKKLTNKQRSEIAIAFMSKVEKAGYYTMLYSSASWLGSKFDWEQKYKGVALKHFDVWCAAYLGSQAAIEKYFKGKYGIWQYSSSVVVESVYKSRLDHDYAYKDYPKIIRQAGLNHL